MVCPREAGDSGEAFGVLPQRPEGVPEVLASQAPLRWQEGPASGIDPKPRESSRGFFVNRLKAAAAAPTHPADNL